MLSDYEALVFHKIYTEMKSQGQEHDFIVEVLRQAVDDMDLRQALVAWADEEDRQAQDEMLASIRNSI